MAFGTISDPVEAKLLILYILKYCGAKLPFFALNEIIIKENLIEYFIFSDALAELAKSGHIIKTKNDDADFYTFSQSGDEAISLFQKRIPLSIREKAIKEATLVLSQINRNSKIVAKYQVDDDGNYLTTLCILDDKDKFFSMEIKLPTQLQADIICQKFKGNAADVLKDILKILTS